MRFIRFFHKKIHVCVNKTNSPNTACKPFPQVKSFTAVPKAQCSQWTDSYNLRFPSIACPVTLWRPLHQADACLSMNIITFARTMPIAKMTNIGCTAWIVTLVHSILSSSTLIGDVLWCIRFRIPVLRRRSNLGEKIMSGNP